MVAKSHSPVGTTPALSALILLVLIISGCAVVRSDSITKIALLAPFEGRHRDIGYNALYAVRLALSDAQAEDIHLVAVDDGGSTETAVDRIQALNTDPAIKAIIVLGQFSSHPDVQQANDKPLFVIGYWGNNHTDEDTRILSHREISERVTTVESITALDLSSPAVGGDLYMLEQVVDIHPELDNLTIISSGTVPDEGFYTRYVESDLYVPDPNLLATLTYDATGFILSALTTDTAITSASYDGINGTINFTDGYWSDAPINRYKYSDDEIIQTD